MAFKKQYQESGMDTTTQVGGYLNKGTHTVTITQVTDLQETIRITLSNQFGDIFTDSIFVAGKAGSNYSQKMQELLTSLPTDLMQRIVEEDDFRLLEGVELRVNIQRSEGNYIEKRGIAYVIVGEEDTPPYPTIQAARTRLDTLGNRAFLRVPAYMPLIQKVAKGVW